MSDNDEQNPPPNEDDEQNPPHYYSDTSDSSIPPSDDSRTSSDDSRTSSDDSYDNFDHLRSSRRYEARADHYSSEENTTDRADRVFPPRRKKLKSFDGPDRISTLPDTILHQILSFIDTKQVVRSSIISRRWKTLWKAVPTLNFYSPVSNRRRSQKNARNKTNFVRFVDRVLLLRDEDATIEKLSLSTSTLSDLEDWMVIAKRKHVQELHLDYKPRADSELTKFLFSLDIEVLKISTAGHVQIPRYMRVAPHLRTIELSSTRLPYGKTNRDLNLKCPSLENLTIRHCDHRHLRVLEISAPQLKTLVLENQPSDHTSTCQLQISTPSLLSVVLKGTTYKEYSFTNLESLVNAKFDLDEKYPVEAGMLYQVLNGFSNVRNLQLSARTLNASEETSDMMNNFFKPFLNLRCLRVFGFSDGSCVGPICDLLDSSHSVESLVLGIDQFPTNNDWTELRQCFSRLKSIEIQGVTGNEVELKILKFISETAVLLEAFTVMADKKFSLKTRREQASFSFKIHSLPKSSSMVGIFFLV
ncbi:hypothetical protein ACHQM5_011355 [Ranunculus cassubicifolius]